MARTASITLEQVTKAAELLRAEGKMPGVRNVREALGTGSNQTIQALLLKWQAQQPAVALPTAMAASEGFMNAIAAELARVQSLTASAHEKALKEALEARDAAQQEEGRQYAENQRLESLLRDKYKEVAAAEGRAKELEKRIAELKDSDAARIQAEQRAAVAESQVLMLEPRAKLADELQQRVAVFQAQIASETQKPAPRAEKR